jgi:hypothetical protein
VQAIENGGKLVGKTGGVSQRLGPSARQLSAFEQGHIELRQVISDKNLMRLGVTKEHFLQIGNQSAVGGACKISAGNIEGLIEHQTIVQHLAEILGKDRKLKPVLYPVFQPTVLANYNKTGVRMRPVHPAPLSCRRKRLLGTNHGDANRN